MNAGGARARPATSTVDHREIEERQQNRRTALVLASIALVFFLGVIAKYWLLPH